MQSSPSSSIAKMGADTRHLLSQSMSWRSVERELQLARQRLDDLWILARPADRVWAVDRLLREGSLPPDRAARLRAIQEIVRDAWATHRIAGLPGHCFPLDARVAGLQLALAERARDAFLAQEGLFDTLYLVAEGYVRPARLPGPPFRDLWRRRQSMAEELARDAESTPQRPAPGP